MILLAAATTSISGIGRVVYSLGRHQMLPHAFGTFGRRSTLPPAAILGAAAVSSTLVILAASLGNEVRFLASLYSFGVLITFAIAQAAVVRLRYTEPDLPRPFVVPFNVRIGGRPVPVAALIGIPLVAGLWVAALATHQAARIGGPVWLAIGAVLYVVARSRRGAGLFERVEAAQPDLVPEGEGEYETILVPVKLGPIGEEMLATAIKLAEERGGTILALHVIRVPLDLPLDAEMLEQEERASASLIDAKLLAPRARRADRGRDRPLPRDRRGDRPEGDRGRRRPDRARLGAALAAAVAVLQPDRRLRPAQRALRGDGARPYPQGILESRASSG